jgi:transposase
MERLEPDDGKLSCPVLRGGGNGNVASLPGDSEWLADLLRHGLLKASFIPPKPIRELRDLTRYRKTLVQERSQEVNRLQKLLEGANIKLATVATEVLGKSGRDMVEAVIGGEQDAEALAALARGRLRAKLPDLRKALEGRVQPHHRFLLQRILAHSDFLEQSIAQVEQEIEQHLRPFEEAVDLVQSITGLQATTTAGILAEIGIDMTRFPSDKHLASWAGGVSGQQAERGQAPKREDNARQYASARALRGSGLGCCSYQRYLSVSVLSSHCPSPGEEKSHRGPGTQAADHHLSYLTHQEALQRPGS